jgi:hypothetical protein
MPADLPNIEKLVEYETQKHGAHHASFVTRRQHRDSFVQECRNG